MVAEIVIKFKVIRVLFVLMKNPLSHHIEFTVLNVTSLFLLIISNLSVIAIIYFWIENDLKDKDNFYFNNNDKTDFIQAAGTGDVLINNNCFFHFGNLLEQIREQKEVVRKAFNFG